MSHASQPTDDRECFYHEETSNFRRSYFCKLQQKLSTEDQLHYCLIQPTSNDANQPEQCPDDKVNFKLANPKEHIRLDKYCLAL